MAEPSLRPGDALRLRRAGVLLPIPALPGPGACGRIDATAFSFVERLAGLGATLWQVLPVGPVNASGSPYQTYSVIAGDPRLVDPAELARTERGPELARFRERERGWLEDYALFRALHLAQREAPWTAWDPPLRDRDPAALARAARRLRAEVEQLMLEQAAFDRAWRALRAHAHACGVLLFGDAPLYPALDSAEVWTARALFDLDAEGHPAEVAGVPPDAFAPEGQRWGNALYRWDAHAAEGFAWWLRRLRADAARYDLLRLDHFRGLEAYWAIPAGDPDARDGRWRPARGRELLRAAAALDPPPALVAEDLGVITPEVEALRADFALPGMRVLQFGFDGEPGNPHHPANLTPECVLYTGTHDNDTTLGWWSAADAAVRARVGAVTDLDRAPMPWPLVDLALASAARLVVLPLQDCLALGSAARTNTPGTTVGNWRWRAPDDALAPERLERLAGSIAAHGRAPRGGSEPAP